MDWISYFHPFNLKTDNSASFDPSKTIIRHESFTHIKSMSVLIPNMLLITYHLDLISALHISLIVLYFKFYLSDRIRDFSRAGTMTFHA